MEINRSVGLLGGARPALVRLALGASLAACGAEPGSELAGEPVSRVSSALTQVFSDNFGPSLNQWTQTGEGDFRSQVLASASGYPGTGSGGLTATVTDCDTECTITSPVLNLTGGSNASLSFLRFVDGDFDADDYARVELFNGTSWVRVRNWFGGSGDTNAWVAEKIDLSSYVGVAGFRVRFVVKATSGDELFQLDDVRVFTSGPIGALTSTNVGNTGLAGSTAVSGGTYTLRGAGSDIWHTSDAFRFMHRSLSGDGQVTARIQSVTEPNTWTKVGVMIRDSLAPDAKNAFMLLRPSAGSAFQWRDVNGGGTGSTWQDAPPVGWNEHRVRWLKPSKWLRMTRQGNVFSVYTSDDGACWSFRWKQTVAFDDAQAFYGVALASQNPNALATTTISNFDVQGSVDPINSECDRAAVDGDLAMPPNWLFSPGRAGGATWHYTTTNPNGTVTPVKCDPGQADAPDGEPAERKDGPDHPNCPDLNASPAWTRPEFVPGNSWQMNAQAGFGSHAPVEGDKLMTTVNSRGLWLRKTFAITSQAQKDGAMLWGRWGEGITVYINGILATSNGRGTGSYRHLGLSSEARASLNIGTNVIAVRLEWDKYEYDAANNVIQVNAWDRFFDLGLTNELRLAHLPVDRMTEPSTAYGAYVTAFKEALQKQGVSGASLAVMKNGQTLVSAGFGFRDKHLTTFMPRDAVMRLASNDKVITQAAIVKLISEGRITPSTPVFPLLNLTAVPGSSPGANVNSITVEHLRTHRSGIGNTSHSQEAVDELAFKFGITAAQWNKHHNARWLYSLPATDVGGAGRYSSNGYFMLRYLAEHLIAPRTLEQYLAGDMGLADIVVSRERLAGRHTRDTGYINREPTWDRWMALESYLALSASATGYASFLDKFGIGYDLQSNGTYRTSGGGVMGGGMAGTWSIAISDEARRLNIVMIANNGGNFDEAFRRVDAVTFSDHCLFGAVDPRPLTGRHLYIQNALQATLYINNEIGLAASSVPATSWSSQWILEAVDAGHFRIKNRWTGQYLGIGSGGLQLGTLQVLTGQSAHWAIVPATSGYNIRSRVQSTQHVYLSPQTGQLTSSPTQASATSAQWRFCN
ncbi:MAG TPA: serine hydrolase [Polyangiaceae bacterium]|nr:serine hydrolase [Polyangiaceae bacterium]